MDKKDMRAAYKKEAGGLINKLEKGLDRLTNGQQGVSGKQRFFRLFVYAHTLKGISGLCGYDEIETSAGDMAEALRAAKTAGKLGLKELACLRKRFSECKKALKRYCGIL